MTTEENKKKLFTLVLLVKGRDKFTERWIKYIDKINFKYPIIISDGANDDFVKNLTTNYPFKNKINIDFKQFNTNDGFKSYYEMKRDTLKEVKTKYVMICDNDDFIIESGLDEIINFLENNNDYISASGKILNFEIENWKIKTYGNFYFLPTYKYARLEDPVKDWNEQINLVFKSFQPNFYNIFKTEILKNIFGETAELNFSDLTINEFFIQLRANSMGRSKILPVHHYIRQRGTSQISNNFDFASDIIKKDLPLDIRRLKEYICKIISTEKNLDKKELLITFEKSFTYYLRKTIAGTMLRYRFPRMFKFKIFLKELWLENLKFFSSKVKKLNNIYFLKFKLHKLDNKIDIINIIKFLEKKN
jgi:glycosyltransferase domain-containing protein